jgi:hypothetical protein
MLEKMNLGRRPKCCVSGCKSSGQFLGTYNVDGTARFRRYCTTHHYQRQAEKKGLTVTQWANAWHPYRQYRKDFCENAKGTYAGWLHFKCTTRIVMPDLQLDTDHIDGNPSNNEPDNLMTLCKCCHAIKTNLFGDYKTKGRKALSVR